MVKACVRVRECVRTMTLQQGHYTLPLPAHLLHDGLLARRSGRRHVGALAGQRRQAQKSAPDVLVAPCERPEGLACMQHRSVCSGKLLGTLSMHAANS